MSNEYGPQHPISRRDFLKQTSSIVREAILVPPIVTAFFHIACEKIAQKEIRLSNPETVREWESRIQAYRKEVNAEIRKYLPEEAQKILSAYNQYFPTEGNELSFNAKEQKAYIANNPLPPDKCTIAFVEELSKDDSSFVYGNPMGQYYPPMRIILVFMPTHRAEKGATIKHSILSTLMHEFVHADEYLQGIRLMPLVTLGQESPTFQRFFMDPKLNIELEAPGYRAGIGYTIAQVEKLGIPWEQLTQAQLTQALYANLFENGGQSAYTTSKRDAFFMKVFQNIKTNPYSTESHQVWQNALTSFFDALAKE